MKHKTVVRHKQRLDALFERVKSLDHDPEMIAHWSRYLCVRVSGFIETSIRSILAEYIQNRAAPEVAKFAGQRLQGFANAKMEKILVLLGEFGAAHRTAIETATIDEIKDAVDSVVSNRHQIAHGEDVGISYGTIQNYYRQVIKVLEVIEDHYAV